MSIRIYRLLRNNKEEGPFTSEELVQKNLRPYDLIWIDGRSAAWSYPSELPEFKKFAPLAVEENKQQAAAVSPSIQAALAVNDNISKASPHQKPRYKVAAAWNRIQTFTAPVFSSSKATDEKKTSFKKNMVTTQVTGQPAKSLSWEEAWLDWEKEKKGVNPLTESLKNKPAAVRSKKGENQNTAPVLETKYSQSLDDLKDQYIENILKQKQSNKPASLRKSSGIIVPAIALLVIFGSAYWLLSGDEETAAALNKTTLKKDRPAAPVQNSRPASIPASDSINTASKTTPREKESTLIRKPAAIDQAEERRSFERASEPVTPKQHAQVKQTKKIPEKQFVPPVAESAPIKTTKEIASVPAGSIKTIREKDKLKDAGSIPITANSTITTSKPAHTTKNDIITKDNVNNNDIDKVVVPLTSTDEAAAVSKGDMKILEKTNVKKTSADYVTTPEYIKMINGSANFKIENISDVDLDLVVVDVQYFDASNRFRKGETLYLHNLRAGKNVMVKTPKDSNSLYATSKVSLISSDKKQLYVVGDN